MRVRLLKKLALVVAPSCWFPGVKRGYGPQKWPWWRWVSFEWLTVTNACPPPAISRRLWAYTRWGSWNCDVSIDLG